MQGQKSPTPIKRDPGDRFALGSEPMLSANSHVPCKCDERHLRLHSISGSAVSGPLGGTGVSSLEGRALAEGGPGALHTPPHTLTPAHPDARLRSCGQNGRGASSRKDPSSSPRFRVAAGSSANDVTWPVWDDSRDCLSRPLSGQIHTGCWG